MTDHLGLESFLAFTLCLLIAYVAGRSSRAAKLSRLALRLMHERDAAEAQLAAPRGTPKRGIVRRRRAGYLRAVS